jgi:hypothetical protein
MKMKSAGQMKWMNRDAIALDDMMSVGLSFL